MEPREIIDWTLRTRLGHASRPGEQVHIDAQPPFREAHYLDGFGYPDGRFRFGRTGPRCRTPTTAHGPWAAMPSLPDHWGVIEEATDEHPFRLATSPARHFLNSTFTETPTSRAKERRPEVMIHPLDAAPRQGIADGDWVKLRNHRGEVFLRARSSTACGAAC
jgi:anaerobic selenocysteine-containing dehydrogenase